MSAREPVPAMASTGVAQANLLYYLHALAAESQLRGVRIFSLLISRLVERSAAAALFDSGHFGEIAPDASRGSTRMTWPTRSGRSPRAARELSIWPSRSIGGRAGLVGSALRQSLLA